jgi:hypothetical protein
MIVDLADFLPIPWDGRASIHSPEPGYTVEKIVTDFDFGLEGYLLGHCLGTKDVPDFKKNHELYSIRDVDGIPHATILYARDRKGSPYGSCDDFMHSTPARIFGEDMHLLQVRGRHDRIAARPYHRMARKFHKAYTGRILASETHLDIRCMWIGDRDWSYHNKWKFEENFNQFNPEFRGENEARFVRTRN